MPADVVAQFKKETGIDVEVTLSNNEEMISKLRATGGPGFDLAQPSQDRITGPQQEFGIYKPMDLTKIKTELFIPAMLDATKKNTMLAGKVYGLPHIWAPTDWWSTPNSPAWPTTPTCASRTARATSSFAGTTRTSCWAACAPARSSAR